jgi:methionyl-tRNA formyltransferase
MRVVFMGTPQFAVPALSAIVGHGHEVVAVYTRAPQPAGRRGLALTSSPVQTIAEQFAIPVFTPKTLRDESEADIFRSHEADVAVVVAYGLILPKPILAAPIRGCLNLHASLLPRWRGAAPIQRAIMAGDAETGIMVMRMEEGLDTGPVSLAERVPIGPDATASEMHDVLSPLGADLITRALAALARESLVFHPQAETGVTYAHKISKEECRIDWARPAREVHNHIRGLSPSPGSFFEANFGRGGERIKVLRSSLTDGSGPPGTILDDQLTMACGDGAVRLLTLQRAGKAPMDGASFLRGARLPTGALRK